MGHKEKTAAELLAELQADPEHVKMRKEKEEELRHRRLFRERAEQPLVHDLRIAGCEVESVWDLVGSKDRYPQAITVLLAHLERDYPSKIREGIARALSVPVLDREEWEIVRSHFVREQDEEAKWALALAVATNAREDDREQLIELVNDPSNGKGRSALAEALFRFRNERADAVLLCLKSDPEIGMSIERLLDTGTTIVD